MNENFSKKRSKLIVSLNKSTFFRIFLFTLDFILKYIFEYLQTEHAGLFVFEQDIVVSLEICDFSRIDQTNQRRFINYQTMMFIFRRTHLGHRAVIFQKRFLSFKSQSNSPSFIFMASANDLLDMRVRLSFEIGRFESREAKKSSAVDTETECAFGKDSGETQLVNKNN